VTRSWYTWGVGDGIGVWTAADEALCRTFDVLAAVATGRLDGQEGVRSIDPLIAPEAEVLLVEGSYDLRGPLNPGDGLFEDAVEHQELWVTERRIREGRIYVSTHGFYLRTRSRLTTWPWEYAGSVAVARRSAVRFSGSTGRDYPTSFTLQTHWAELVFCLWSLARLPRELRVLNLPWLPHDWRQHAEAHDRWPAEQLADLHRALGDPP
jgi:hypothetical protein